VAENRLPEALAGFDKAAGLDPSAYQAPLGREIVALMQERWADAEAVNRAFGESPNPFERWGGPMMSSIVSVAHGDGAAALADVDRAARVSEASVDNRISARLARAGLLLSVGKPEEAVSDLKAGLPEARGRSSEYDALRLLAVAQARAGRLADARQALTSLEAAVAKVPGGSQKLQLDWARGEVALASGDHATAIEALSRAAGASPARDPVTSPGSQVDLWFSLASAYLAAGRAADAQPWLERIVAAGHERVWGFASYVRSHYLLAGIYDKRGDHARANQLYTRFLSFWRNGDMDRAQVTDAQRKLGGGA
jgi:tetratricopeptide (TPR) repeat protein